MLTPTKGGALAGTIVLAGGERGERAGCYVWDEACELALELRQKHRILGRFVGRRRPGCKEVGDAVLPVKLLPEEAALVLKHGFVSLSLLSPLRGAGAGGDAVVEELGTGAGGGRITIPHVPPRQNATVREGGSVLALRRGESVEEGWGLMMDAAEAGVGDGAQWRTLWRFPSTEDEERRMRVFEDLWAQGFWVTDGLKFGATFLAYKGDPRDHHASHLVTVAAANEPFPAIGLVAKGRVATAANKRCVLASFERVMDDGGSVQEGKGALVYTTIEFEPSLSSARSAAFD